jgi:pilus assembly protein CpaF
MAFDLPGFAPIRHLLLDPEITEVMINGPRQIYIERHGCIEAIAPVFGNASQLQHLVANLIEGTGRAVNHTRPMADFRLDDGSRVNIVISPIALDGPIVTIRKFTKSLRSLGDMVLRGALEPRMASFLEIAIKSRLNIMFSGGTASGKTTMLGVLSRSIPESERVVVIEDTAELDLHRSHVVRLECRPPNVEGSGAVPLGELLKNALRMRPTRILVGEVRGDEAFEMLHAMASGHDGTLAVMHASSPAHAIARLELMILARGLAMPMWATQRMIANSLDLVLQFQLFSDGSRRLTNISEVGTVLDGEVQLHPLFEYMHEGFDESGRALGKFVTHGRRPAFESRMRLYGGDAIDALLAPP